MNLVSRLAGMHEAISPSLLAPGAKVSAAAPKISNKIILLRCAHFTPPGSPRDHLVIAHDHGHPFCYDKNSGEVMTVGSNTLEEIKAQ